MESMEAADIFRDNLITANRKKHNQYPDLILRIVPLFMQNPSFSVQQNVIINYLINYI